MSESLGMVPQSALAIAVAAPVGGIYDYLAGPAVGARVILYIGAR